MALVSAIIGIVSVVCSILTGWFAPWAGVAGIIFGILAFLAGVAAAVLGVLTYKSANGDAKLYSVIAIATGILGFTLGLIFFSQAIVWGCASCLACRYY